MKAVMEPIPGWHGKTLGIPCEKCGVAAIVIDTVMRQAACTNCWGFYYEWGDE